MSETRAGAGDAAADEAWRAFEEGRLAEADRLWRRLIDAASDRDRDAHRGRHAYVLVALGRFEEARSVYAELFGRHGSHKYLHQLGMVEREAGNYREALAIFEREARILVADDMLGQGANCYERALLHHLLGSECAALGLLEECLGAALHSEDPTMIAVAWRLKGDLLAERDPAAARVAYEAARHGFIEARDERGRVEVEERLTTLGPG